MNLRKLFVVFLFCAPVWLFCQTTAGTAASGSARSAGEKAAAPPAGKITDITITGLKRTKPHIARYPLEQFLGQNAADVDLNEVRGAVMETSVLEPVDVTLEETADKNGVVLHVTVEEKWSFIPMPMLAISGKNISAGLFLMDTNAFGLRDQAMIGGMYGTNAWTAMFMYNLTPDRKGIPGVRTSFMYNRGKRENLDRDEDLLRRYEADTLNAALGLSYSVNSLFGLSFGLSYSDIALTKRAFHAPKDGSRSIGFTPALSLRVSSWDGYLTAEQSLSLSYTYHLALKGDFWHTVEARAVSGFSAAPGFVISLRGAAAWRPGGNALAESHPHLADILPGSFAALHYASFQTGVEKHLFSSRYGILSVIGAWQAVFSSALQTGDTFDHGPIAGVRFYLRRIAVPALGFGFGYNMISARYQFALNMGMGF
jgi:hypothetical protein